MYGAEIAMKNASINSCNKKHAELVAERKTCHCTNTFAVQLLMCHLFHPLDGMYTIRHRANTKKNEGNRREKGEKNRERKESGRMCKIL